MNEAELAGFTADLPEQFVGRVSDSTLTILRSYADVGEWDELLTLLIAGLEKTGARVTRKELSELRTAIEGWGMPMALLTDLSVDE